MTLKTIDRWWRDFLWVVDIDKSKESHEDSNSFIERNRKEYLEMRERVLRGLHPYRD